MPCGAVTAPEGGAGIPDGWLTLRAEFDDEAFARFVVLGLGTSVRAIEPAEFRRSVITEASAVAGQEKRRNRKQQHGSE